MAKRKFVIDCDTGTDDAQAILMALACQDIEVIAITTVFGNTDVSRTTTNTLRVLKAAGRLDIPVYRGCGRSLLGVGSRCDGFMGDDALGDLPDRRLTPAEAEGSVREEHAAVAIVNIVNRLPGEVTLVCTGPLTNMATALQLAPALGSRLRHCYVMGGSLSGRGNVALAQEFNVFSDQEAAYAVLTNLHAPLTLLPLEPCDAAAPSWEWYEAYTSLPTPLAQFVRAVDNKRVAMARRDGEENYSAIWDQLIMAIAINGEVASEQVPVYVTVELRGAVTRGQMVVDWRRHLGRPPNCHLVTAVRAELLYQMMTHAVAAVGDVAGAACKAGEETGEVVGAKGEVGKATS